MKPYCDKSINDIKERLNKQGWILYYFGNKVVCLRNDVRVEASGDTLIEAAREAAEKARKLDK